MNENNTCKKGYNILSLRTFAIVALFALSFAWSGIVSNNWIKLALGFVGSGSITLFLFMLEEGYRNTSNLTKYMLRLLVLAIISAFPYYLVFGEPGTSWYLPRNIFSSPLTMFLCLGSMALYDKMKTKQLKIVCVVFLSIVSFVSFFEWCPYAIILAFIIHIYYDDIRYRDFYIFMFFVTFAIVSAAMYFMEYMGTDTAIQNISLAGCAWPIFLIRKYNGERGKRVRVLSYAVYPLILIGLFLLKYYVVKR